MAELTVRETLGVGDRGPVLFVDIGGHRLSAPLASGASAQHVSAAAITAARTLLARLEAEGDQRTEDRKHDRKCIKALKTHLGAADGAGE